MHVQPSHRHLGRRSVEILELQFADFSAIHSISPLATELLHIKKMRSHTDFFIGIKAHPDSAMLDFRMFPKVDHSLYDFRNTGFVVSSQQGMAVRDNQILSHMIRQFGKLLRRGDNSLFSAQYNVPTIVLLHDSQLHILSRVIRRSIDMSYKADCRHFAFRVCRQRGIQISMFVQRHLLKPYRFQFVLQISRKHHLLVSTRTTFSFFTRLRVKTHVFQKSFYQFHNSSFV